MYQHTEDLPVITLTVDDLAALARLEKTFVEYLRNQDPESVTFDCPQHYQMTLSDLRTALSFIRESDPTVEQFQLCWRYPMNRLDSAFGLPRACGYEDEDSDDGEDVVIDDSTIAPLSDEEYGQLADAPTGGDDALLGAEFFGLPVTDEDVFADIWFELDVDPEEAGADTRMSEALDLDGMIDAIDRRFRNTGKAVEEMEFSKAEKSGFISCFRNDDTVKSASERALALCRRFIEELLPADDENALWVKGYSAYDGNRLYPCDFTVSRDCIKKLYDLTDEPFCAGSLGYIYYYGRCNGGVPQYEESFRYFSIAAANGLHEGMYKLADHFKNGYACKKSPRTAKKLYELVYQDALSQLKAGNSDTFPDAALRMGLVYSEGIGVEKDPRLAWYYLLQADITARKRAEQNDFFGNATVVMNIKNAMEKVRPDLPKDYFLTVKEYSYPTILNAMKNDHHRCELTAVWQVGDDIFNEEEPNRLTLTAKRIAFANGDDPAPILVTIPEIGLSELTDTFSMDAVGNVTFWSSRPGSPVRYDHCTLDEDTNRFCFLYDGVITAYVKADTYTVKAPEDPAKKQEKTGDEPEHRIASVCFQGKDHPYDYLADDFPVIPGDRCIVMGYDGEVEVEVVGVSTVAESELSLPIDRYQKLLRKA